MPFYEVSDQFDRIAPYSGRDDERKRLKRIIIKENSSTVLLSGERGSGKSRLIAELRNELAPSKWKPFGRAEGSDYKKIIFIEIPLPHDVDTLNLKEVVIKNICFALFVSRNKLFWWKSSLRKEVLELYEKAQSIELIQKSKAAREIGVRLREPSKLGLGSMKANSQLSEQEERKLDLSVSNLELHLRALLNHISKKKIRLVFVFDELDKLATDLNPGKIIEQLKNLFLGHNTVTILATTPEYNLTIDEILKTNPYAAVKTFFSQRIQLNPMRNREMTEIANSLFVTKNSDSFRLLVAYLVWKSEGNPFNIYENIRKEGSSDSGKYGIDSEQILESWKNAGQINEFSSFVYANYCKEGQSASNEIVYKALRELGEQLLNGDDFPLYKDPVLCLLDVSDFFEEASDYTEQDLDAEIGNLLTGSLGRIDNFPLMTKIHKELELGNWKKSLFAYDRLLYRVNEALKDFLWLLDRAGLNVEDNLVEFSFVNTTNAFYRISDLQNLESGTDPQEKKLIDVQARAKLYADLLGLNTKVVMREHVPIIQNTVDKMNIKDGKLQNKLYRAELGMLLSESRKLPEVLLLHWIFAIVREHSSLSIEAQVNQTSPIYAMQQFFKKNSTEIPSGMIDPTTKERTIIYTNSVDVLNLLRDFRKENKTKMFCILTRNSAIKQVPGAFMVVRADINNSRFTNLINRINDQLTEI